MTEVISATTIIGFGGVWLAYCWQGSHARAATDRMDGSKDCSQKI